MYLSGIDDTPDLDLQELFDRIFDNYPGEFRDYWGLDAEHPPSDLDVNRWEEYKDLARLATRISEVAKTLVRPRKLPEGDLQTPVELQRAATEADQHLRSIIEQLLTQHPDRKDEISGLFFQIRLAEDVKFKFFLSCLQLELSSFLFGPDEIARRTVDLTRYVARVKTERAVQYLSRVSRCYLYGMHAELAVMARAVLEAVLEDAIPELQVRRIRRIASDRRVGLADYIHVAQGTLLEGDAVPAAWRLKEIGDDAVHVSAEAVGDPTEVLDNLVRVLRCVEQTSK